MFYNTTRFMISQLKDPVLRNNPAFQAILAVTGLAVIVGVILAIPRQKEVIDP